MTQRLAHAEFEPMSRSGSWRVRLIGILMTGVLSLSVAALLPLLAGLPAHAQTPKLSDADKAAEEKRQEKRGKRNKEEIQRLKSVKEKLLDEIIGLELDIEKPGWRVDETHAPLKPAEKQKLEKKLEEKRQDRSKSIHELDYRSLTKDSFLEILKAIEKKIKAIKKTGLLQGKRLKKYTKRKRKKIVATNGRQS